MSDFDREEQKENMEKTRGRSPGKKKKWVIFALVLVVVLAVVLLAAYRGGTGFDVLGRFLTYGKSQGDTAETFTYDTDKTNRFASLDTSLVVLSMTQLRVYDSQGQLLLSESVKLEQPALSVGSELAIAYDVGGSSYIIFNQEEILRREETDEDMPIISASINNSDILSLTTGKSGYKGAVQVYDKELELIFEFNSSSRFVSDSIVMRDGKHVAVVVLEQENATFISNILFYQTDSTELVASVKISDGLVLALDVMGDQVVAVTDTALVFADASGSVSYDYGGAFLREYAIRGDGYAVLQLNRYRSGSMGTLVTVDRNGKELGKLDIEAEVLSVSAAGRYVAVLYADRLVIYTPNLEEYALFRDVHYGKAALMRSDGSAMVAGASQAALYLP